jgi:hypothetical protein
VGSFSAAIDQTPFLDKKGRLIFLKGGISPLVPFQATVTNLANGRSITVEINDVGDIAKYGRVIDLSFAAYDALGGQTKKGVRGLLQNVLVTY